MAARGTDDPHLVILSPGPAVMSADPAAGGKPRGPTDDMGRSAQLAGTNGSQGPGAGRALQGRV
jgi:hypothetical protein